MTPGIGASAVHAESGKIGTRVSDRLISEGANLVIPTVGDTHNKVEFLRDMLQKQGYNGSPRPDGHSGGHCCRSHVGQI